MRTLFASAGAGESRRRVGVEGADRIALFLDVDGTLLDLAERPEGVVVPPALIADLAASRIETHDALALVSGRAIADIDRLFAPLRLPAAGVHGAEIRFDPAEAARPAPGAVALPPALRPLLDDVLRDFPGTFIEDKRFSYAVHYRQAPAAAASLRDRLAKVLETLNEPGIMILQAHCAYELKPRAFDKGRAIAAFLSRPPFAGRTPIFIGDDDTDEAGFAEVAARGGRAFSVGRARPAVAGTFVDPEEVRAWLAVFAGAAV